MDRRTLLKNGIAGAAGLGTGYALVYRSTKHASAAVTGSLEIADAEQTTQDGTVDAVRATVDGNWQYDVPAGKDPHRWRVTLNVSDGEDVEQIGQTTGEALYLSEEGEYSVSGAVTDSELYATDDFSAPEGKRKEVTLAIVVVFTVETNGGGEVLARSQVSDTGTVAVTNEGYQPTDYGEIGGSGELVIEA